MQWKWQLALKGERKNSADLAKSHPLGVSKFQARKSLTWYSVALSEGLLAVSVPRYHTKLLF